MVKKLQLVPFYAICGKKRGKKKKKMMWKTLEQSTNVWHKIGSDVSRKVILASKTNQGQCNLLLWKMRLYLKWLNSQAQSLVNCLQNLVFFNALSIDTSIS